MTETNVLNISNLPIHVPPSQTGAAAVQVEEEHLQTPLSQSGVAPEQADDVPHEQTPLLHRS